MVANGVGLVGPTRVERDRRIGLSGKVPHSGAILDARSRAVRRGVPLQERPAHAAEANIVERGVSIIGGAHRLHGTSYRLGLARHLGRVSREGDGIGDGLPHGVQRDGRPVDGREVGDLLAVGVYDRARCGVGGPSLERVARARERTRGQRDGRGVPHVGHRRHGAGRGPIAVKGDAVAVGLPHGLEREDLVVLDGHAHLADARSARVGGRGARLAPGLEGVAFAGEPTGGKVGRCAARVGGRGRRARRVLGILVVVDVVGPGAPDGVQRDGKVVANAEVVRDRLPRCVIRRSLAGGLGPADELVATVVGGDIGTRHGPGVAIVGMNLRCRNRDTVAVGIKTGVVAGTRNVIGNRIVIRLPLGHKVNGITFGIREVQKFLAWLEVGSLLGSRRGLPTGHMITRLIAGRRSARLCIFCRSILMLDGLATSPAFSWLVGNVVCGRIPRRVEGNPGAVSLIGNPVVLNTVLDGVLFTARGRIRPSRLLVALTREPNICERVDLVVMLSSHDLLLDDRDAIYFRGGRVIVRAAVAVVHERRLVGLPLRIERKDIVFTGLKIRDLLLIVVVRAGTIVRGVPALEDPAIARKRVPSKRKLCVIRVSLLAHRPARCGRVSGCGVVAVKGDLVGDRCPLGMRNEISVVVPDVVLPLFILVPEARACCAVCIGCSAALPD